jgi:polar amino acid transport system substrate-binding protein
VTKDATIAAEVPADVASAGSLTVATDATYAPNEFIPAGGTTIDGMDIDLGEAIGDVMGVKWEFTNASFDTIIPGLASGKYGIGMSSFTDTLERQQTVDFVTYFSAGTSFYVAASGGADVTGLDSLCGLSVGAERGTTQADDATAQSAKCTSAGKPKVDVQVFTDQNGANLALSSGRVDVVMADSPVAAYAVKQSAGQFKLSGTPYGTAPYGIAIPRPAGVAPGSAPMSKPTLDALKSLMASGVYMQILEKWGVQDGAITDPVINGATS